MTATDVLPEGFDFTDPDVNQKAIPHDEYRAARQNTPIVWVEQPWELRSGFADESGSGYFARNSGQLSTGCLGYLSSKSGHMMNTLPFLLSM